MASKTLRARTATAATLLLFVLLLMTACGSQQASSASSENASSESASSQAASASADSASSEEASTSAESSEASANNEDEYKRALSATGLVTKFIGEQFYDKPIESNEDAEKAVESVMDRIGCDDTTTLELLEIRPTETGTTYYTFRQQAGDVVVHGASVKLIVDKDHKAVGLVSAILPNVKIPSMDTWAVTAEQAEQVVLDECKSNGHDSATIAKNATQQTLIALEDGSNFQKYAWVVYTNNYLSDTDAGYLAHYVSGDGDYLYAIPVSEPSNADALAGDEAAFDFAKMKEDTWSGTVTKMDGTKMDIKVPVLIDPDDNSIYLGDAKRKILCADYAKFNYEDLIAPRMDTGDGFMNNELLIYDTFIRVWDYYDGIGWTSPDDNGTPTLLQMDMVDPNGNVIQNACYNGRKLGWQTFAFNRIDPDGECIDVIAHEFTHCVTGTTMTSNVYMNDPGAINEAMSDIMGNLVEMTIAYDPKGAWQFGENDGAPTRSMDKPHTHSQPEFTWDQYYGPAVSEGTIANDRGGVHINSSLLSLVSYKLDQAGMSIDDQVYFWMNVALAMTPSTDYPQMAELLPWCMTQAGYPQYVDAVKKAIDEGLFTTVSAPNTPIEGAGFVKAALPSFKAANTANIRVVFYPASGEASNSNPISWLGANANDVVATLPVGEYKVRLVYFDGDNVISSLWFADNSWVSGADTAPDNSTAITVTSGETTEIPSTGLEVLDQQAALSTLAQQ